MGEAATRGVPLEREYLVEDEGPQPLPLVEGDPLTLPPRVSSRVKRELHPPPPLALPVPTRVRTPRSVSSIGTSGAASCRCGGEVP